jgi:hypothetical protein
VPLPLPPFASRPQPQGEQAQRQRQQQQRRQPPQQPQPQPQQAEERAAEEEEDKEEEDKEEEETPEETALKVAARACGARAPVARRRSSSSMQAWLARVGQTRTSWWKGRFALLEGPPCAPAWWLTGHRPLLHTPERGLSSSEACRRLRSSPRRAPKTASSHLLSTRLLCDVFCLPGMSVPQQYLDDGLDAPRARLGGPQRVVTSLLHARTALLSPSTVEVRRRLSFHDVD